MLTQQRIRRALAPHCSSGPQIRTPCVAIHTEESQVERFVARAQTLEVDGSSAVAVCAVAPPLIYVQATPQAASAGAVNAALRVSAERAFGGGRIAAHRVYQLDASCSDPQWIIHSQAFRAASQVESFAVRVVAFPRMLQAKMTELVVASGFATHPTEFTHELFVAVQPQTSSLFYFGIAPREQAPSTVFSESREDASVGPTTRAEAPCRAFFKLQESLLHYVPIVEGDHVLDVGASPGGWTDCLLRHGACVVAVDPGELTIPLAGRPVVHLQSLLEDAFDQLERMDKFAMAVCDINVRVATMAALMLRVAPLLQSGARIVFTLKLGKKPTPQTVQDAFAVAQRILSPAFERFQLVWLHANTQNERTLFAVKRNN